MQQQKDRKVKSKCAVDMQLLDWQKCMQNLLLFLWMRS